MADDVDYGALIDGTSAQGARVAVAQTADHEPDGVAKARALARTYGIPESAATLPDVKRRATIDSIDYDQLAKDNPRTTTWLSNPANASIGRDDTGPLGSIERMVGDAFTKNYAGASLISGLHSTASAGSALVQTGVDLMSGGESFGDTLSYLSASKDPKARAMASRLAAGKPGDASEQALYAMDYFGRLARSEFQAAQGATANLSPEQQAIAARKYGTLDPSKSAFLSPTKLGGDLLQNLPTMAALYMAARTGNKAALQAEAEAVAAGETDAAILAKVRGQAAAKALATQGAISEGAIGYAQQAEQTRDQVLGMTDEALAKSPQFQALLKAGFEPQVAKIVMADAAAKEGGVIAGVADFTTNLAGGAVLGHVIGEGGPWLTRILRGAATEGVQEAVQSPLEQVGQNLAVQQNADPKQKLSEGVLESALQGLAMGGLSGGAMAGVHGRGEARVNAAQEAVANGETFKLMDQMAAASKLRERDPASFEQFVKDAAEDGPVENIYVNAKVLGETLAQAGVDPTALGLDPAEVTQAAATGGDVQIPVERYATRVAGTDLSAALLPHLKTDPAGMSMAEADEFMQSHAEELKAQVEKVVTAAEQDQGFKASADVVRQGVLDQLNTAKRFTPDVNEAYAQLMGQFYAVNAARQGITPEEMFARHPVKIAAEDVTGAETLDQHSDPTSTPEFKTWFGESKVVDEHGAPLVVYHGTNAEFSEFEHRDTGNDRGGGGWLGKGFYFHPDKGTAEAYGTKQMPVYLKLENPYDFAGQNFHKVVTEHGGPEAFSEWLRANGYDGAKGMSQLMVLDQTQIKSTANGGSFNPNDPNILRQDLPAPYYSALEKAVLDTQTAKASPEQWAATLQKTPGVKKEELEWTGVLDWLDTQKAAPGANAKASVTKEEVAAYLRNNGVQVEEVLKGEGAGEDSDEVYNRADELHYESWASDYTAPDWEVREVGEEPATAEDESDLEDQQPAEEKPERDPNTPDLFTPDQAPHTEKAKRYFIFDAGNDRAHENGEIFDSQHEAEIELETMLQQHRDLAWERESEDGTPDWAYDQARNEVGGPDTEFSGYKIDGADDTYRELLLTLPKIDGPGTHWKERNVVAHVRFTERTGADGKPVLFLEEVQSDWHQNAAKDAKDAQKPALNKALSDISDFYDHVRSFPDSGVAWPSPWSLAQKDSVRVAAMFKWWKEVGSKASTMPEDAERLGRLKEAVAQSVADYEQAKKDFTGYAMRASPEKLAEANQAYDAAKEKRAAAYQALADRAAPILDKIVDEAQAKLDQAKSDYETAAAKVEDFEKQLQAMTMAGEEPDEAFRLAYNAATQARSDADTKYRRVSMYATSYPNMRDKALGRSDYWSNAAIETRAQALADMIMHAKDRSELAHGLVDDAAGLRAANLRVNEAFQALEHASGSRGIPNAPFKASYAQLVMKRMIRWAVDNGHDRIAWITGDQQNGGSDQDELGDWFYGRNLPNMVNDLVKKYGTKVEPIKVELPGQEREVWSPEDAALVDAADDARRQARDAYGEASTQYEEVADRLKAVRAAADLMMVPREAIGPLADEMHAASDVREQARAAYHAAVKAKDQALASASASPQLGFKITPELASAAQEGFALFQNGAAPRGSFNPATATITLLRAADLSTFLHESGHFFLETLTDMASSPGASQGLTDDMNTVLHWFGVDSLATWRGMTLNEQRESHEKFARGFEAYLLEGKAPAQQLVPIFQRFRAWLLNVYKSLSALRVELPDEIKGVFNRMLATNAQIMENERALGYAPLFASAAEAGMSPVEFEDYQRLGMTATQDAVHDLETRSLRDMRWLSGARDRTIRRMQREAAERRKAVRAEVSAEVAAEPINQARTFLKRGTIGGEAVEGSTKLSLPALRAMYGEAPSGLEEATGQGKLETDYRKLGYGKYGMLGEEGLEPDHVAELFGFSSGDELVKTLLSAEDPQAKIAGLTDQRMLERYGDLHDPQSIERAADQAVHNDARLRFVATEMNALAKATGQRRVLATAARDYAAQMIAKLRVRDLKPSRWTAAEARAGVSAEKALKGGKLVEAATEKRNQLINGYAAKAAYAAQEEMVKAARYLAKFSSDGVRKNIDPAYRDQIDALLERFDLRKGESLKAIDKRKSLASWIESQREMGYDPVIPPELENEAFRKSYKDMSVEEMRGLVDSVRNIEHLGRLKTKLLTAKKDREFAEARDTMAETIRANAYKEIKDKLERNTVADRLLSGAASFFATHRKFASFLRSMDGLKDRGPLWELLGRTMNDRTDQEAVMRGQATKALHGVFEPLFKLKLRDKLHIPEINGSLSLEGRLSIALNWGNEVNRSRVMDGDKWTAEQVQAILKTLTPEQWAFVQGVWDHIDTYWPMIREKELRVSGVAPEKSDAAPFTTPGGIDMRGGYYPIKYDPARSSRSEADTLAEMVKASMQGLYSRATTRRGHTISRVETVDRPMRKDLGVVFEHVNQVIHDLTWHEWLIDANRLLRSSEVDQAIRQHYGAEVLSTMKDHLNAIAAGDIPAQNSFERAVNHLRTGATMAGLGYNLVTALLQPIGLTQSVVRIGPKWVLKGMTGWAVNAAHAENTVKWVNAKSDFMRLRAETRLREVAEIRNKVSAGAGGPLSAVQEGMFYLIGKLQLVVDVPTWLGAYEKSMAQGSDEDSAVAFADQAVRDSQGGGTIADISQIQRGGPLMKLWTNFYSFFNVVYNQLSESVEQTRREGVKRSPILAADVLLLMVLPSILTTALRKGLRGDDLDTYPADLLKDQVSTWFGLMVGMRELGSIISSDGDYKGPAGMRFLTDAAGLYKQAEQGQPDAAMLKALNSVGGVLFHYPSGQIQRTVTGFQALASGQTHNPLALVSGPPQKAHR